MRRSRGRLGALLGVTYVALLVVSLAVRAGAPAYAPARPGQQLAHVPLVEGAGPVLPGSAPGPGEVGEEPGLGILRGGLRGGAARSVRLAFGERGPEGAPTLLLLHGSPGSGADFTHLAPLLEDRYRVLVPDLPGFGSSERRVPDYSIRAHAEILARWLEARGEAPVHVVGFSMGGGVAIELTRAAPDRVASLTLLSAIGAQEFELLGDYHMNRAVHGVQLGALWLARELLPHMGALDGAFLGVEYGRNFFDTDQRPLRGLLERWRGPTLIVHGRDDVLVPVEAAEEHHRIVPQSELVLTDDGHFMVFARPALVAAPIADFVARAARGAAPTRDDAGAERLALAARPFDPRDVPKAEGIALLVLAGLIILASLVSEDLACVGAGIMVAAGRIDFLAGTLACLVGITLGDVSLFLAGRVAGAAALGRWPLRWFVSAARVEHARRWFEERGLVVVLLTRFTPGLRLPTYVAAGIVGTRFPVFLAYFLIAAVIWTPLLVGLSAFIGFELDAWIVALDRATLPTLLLVGAGVVVGARLTRSVVTYRGRRRWVSRWHRWTRWEFWPPWLFYLPLVPRIVRHAWRAGGLTTFTAANPAIPSGGFVGESKLAILEGLGLERPWVARTRLVPAGGSAEERAGDVERAIEELGLAYPVVLKPDKGQRGRGVAIVRGPESIRAYLSKQRRAILVQEHVPGVEFGVFWVRRPGEERGQIFSITEKRMPAVTGDGESTIEQLILRDARAVVQSRLHFAQNAERLDAVPAAAETIELTELGTHCRGAMFLDGRCRLTPELERALDEISRPFDGFFFGRYDIRVPSAEDFEAGRGLTVIELNGVTSEATHIYDPGTPLREAYRVLDEQWRLAYEIGRANAERGHPVSTPGELWRLLVEDRRAAASR